MQADVLPEVSVVVPCRGHAEQLAGCLTGLERQVLDTPYEVIVVDSSDDDSVVDVTARFPHVRLVRSDDGLLPGAARNLGVSAARGEYLVFTDADCVPESEFLDAAVRALSEGAIVVGGPLLDLNPWHLIAAADNLLQFAEFPPSRRDGPASGFPGCNVAIRRAHFTELGGFPAPLLRGRNDKPSGDGMDSLFCELAHNRWPDGMRFVQRMRVRHAGRTSLSVFWRHQEAFGHVRGRRGLKLRPIYQRFGSSWLAVAPVGVKRFGYIGARTAQWRPLGLPRMILLTPLLVLGLTAWALGFRRGCKESIGSRETGRAPREERQSPAGGRSDGSK